MNDLPTPTKILPGTPVPAPDVNPATPAPAAKSPVTPFSVLVADNFASDDAHADARICLVLRPEVADPLAYEAKAPGAATKIELRAWPSEATKLFFHKGEHGKETTQIHVVPVFDSKNATADYARRYVTDAKKNDIDTRVDARLAWSSDDATAKRIDDLWRRMMAPASDRRDNDAVWDDLRKTLTCPPSTQKTSVVIPTPHAAASLAFTLERGRMVLDALARDHVGPGSHLQLPQAALDRPWYDGEPRTRLASLGSVAIPDPARSPQYDEYWLAPYRERTRAALADEAPPPIWPSPSEFVAAALGDGEKFHNLVEKVQAAHYLTTPLNPSYAACSTDLRGLQTAARRYGALLALPSLQRLFGLAFDLQVDHEKLLSKAGGAQFVLIAPAGPAGDDASQTSAFAGAAWSLARIKAASDAKGPSYFMPATELEMQRGEAEGLSGLVNLGGETKYDIITVDAPLASESSIMNTARNAGDGKPNGSALSPVSAGPSMLHNGGLRVVRYNHVDKIAEGLTACPDRGALYTAESLEIGTRLMVGVQGQSGMIWRSPDYRVIRFEDPTQDKDWVEAELRKRAGDPGSAHRLALDGAMTKAVSQELLDQPPEGNDTSSPELRAAIKKIAESTIAAWGLDPAGVSPPKHRESDDRSGGDGDEILNHKSKVVEELDITRRFSAPTSQKSSGGFACDFEALSPVLRFGWPYFVALPRVFEGGVSANVHQTRAIVNKSPTLALPDGKQGRRFLRHEAVGAPMALIFEGDFPTLDKLEPQQHGADMYVRTLPKEGVSVERSRRLLVPPPVPLQFAMLHDVVKEPGKDAKRPREGLAGLSLIGKPKGKKPIRVRVGAAAAVETTGSPYFPDPAASLVVFGLTLPTEGAVSDQTFVDPPLSIVVGAKTWPDETSDSKTVWPDVTPIHLTLVRTNAKPGREGRIVDCGPQWLGPNEVLHKNKVPGSVPVHAVEVRLRPGEDLRLHAWCVPTVRQLARWFDACEAAGVLALNASVNQREHADCVSYLERELDTDFNLEAAHTACRGAGGLKALGGRALMQLAGLIHRELLLRPITALANRLSMRVTHAVQDSLLPRPEIGPQLAVTRRHFPGGDDTISTKEAARTAGAANGKAPAWSPDEDNPNRAGLDPDALDPAFETRTDFLAATEIADWGPASIQEGATGALFGGDIRLDPCSSNGFILEAMCASPFAEDLDPQVTPPKTNVGGNQAPQDKTVRPPFGFIVKKDDHTVDFVRQRVPALTVQGLPLRERADGLHSYRLQDLLAAAWGPRNQGQDALRATLHATFTASGARKLWLRASPINRHGGLLGKPECPTPDTIDTKGPPHIWLPATVRPSPPVIDHITVALVRRLLVPRKEIDGSFTVGVEERSVIRIWHARPFFSSGEGEKLGVVLWPPAILTRGSTMDSRGNPLLPEDDDKQPAAFYDEDLGPGGQYTTRWVAEPLTAGDATSFKAFLDPEWFDQADRFVPHAFMPVPINGAEDWASGLRPPKPPTDPQAQQEKETRQAAFMSVALQTFEPRFDEKAALWYFDLPLRTERLPHSRIRLGLVRYQEHAREDALPPEGSEPVRLRVSIPIKRSVKPLPGRKATATYRRRRDGFDVIVVVSGPCDLPNGSRDFEALPTMEVEVVRYRRDEHNAQDETACDYSAQAPDGRPAICSDWSESPSDKAGVGYVQRIGSDLSWTAMFSIRGQLEDSGWRHAVLVREARSLPKASAKGRAETGSTFGARIRLDPPL